MALLTLLKPRKRVGHENELGPPILIANTHLLFNPKRGDIKVQDFCIGNVCRTASLHAHTLWPLDNGRPYCGVHMSCI